MTTDFAGRAMRRPSPDGPEASERNRPRSVLISHRDKRTRTPERARASALLTGRREYVLASLHSRLFVLIHYIAPDTNKLTMRRGVPSIYG